MPPEKLRREPLRVKASPDLRFSPAIALLLSCFPPSEIEAAVDELVDGEKATYSIDRHLLAVRRAGEDLLVDGYAETSELPSGCLHLALQGTENRLRWPGTGA